MSELGMDPGAQLSLFSAWRHPVMGAGMELSQAAYRYNQNMMEYYTCKTELAAGFGGFYSDGKYTHMGESKYLPCLHFQVTEVSTSWEDFSSTAALCPTL